MAIWDCFSVNAPKATMKAIAAPTQPAPKKPNNKLLVVLAIANPVIAPIKIVPSADRLITPARSVIVSPRQPKTSGVEVAIAVAKIAII